MTFGRSSFGRFGLGGLFWGRVVASTSYNVEYKDFSFHPSYYACCMPTYSQRTSI